MRRVVAPLLSGGARPEFTTRDLEYVRDLGLIAGDDPPRIANPIYAEVVPRELTYAAQAGLIQDVAWYVDRAGRLDMHGMIGAFQTFFREHSEHWVERFQYREAGPQLLLQAFLQRVVNGGGRVEREYGLGRGCTDLLILWPEGERTRRYVVECKVRHRGLQRTIQEGLEQIRRYMDRCDAESGHLIVFDRSEDRTWQEKIFRREAPGLGAPVTIWGM